MIGRAPALGGEHRRRRQRLLRRLRGAAAIFTAAPERVFSNDVHHRYRQDSDFHYLTGLDEPEAVGVLVPGRDPFTLLVRPKDPVRAVWDGPRAGVQGAMEEFAADDAHPLHDLRGVLQRRMSGVRSVAFSSGGDAALERRVRGALRGLRPAPEIVELSPILHEMRLLKSEPELRLMRGAAQITCAAHRAGLAAVAPGRHEYEVQAVIEAEFLRRGAEGPAYATIVGSGPNACVLHHIRNDRRMRRGDLVLIDAGCSYGLYSADVTRTLPVSGRFSKAQRELYDVVLSAQQAAIAAVRPGNRRDAPHAEAVKILVQGMIDTGLLKGSFADALSSGAYRRYYMHHTSHWLGLDVHDVGAARQNGRPRRLRAGMVLTVEPGLYVPEDDGQAPSRFRGIGIRIEDDVAVTGGHPEVLTAALPKSVARLERLLQR